MATKTLQKEIKNPKLNRAETVSFDRAVYSQKGTSAGTITLPKKVFGLKWNADLVHQVVVGMQANARAGIAHTKDRSEVSGGGKKPWKQKGTGRARHGSNRSPIWVGGGTTFGPRNDKDYSQKINKKTRIKALFTVLSKKLSQNAIVCVDDIVLPGIKTKEALQVMSNLSKIEHFEKINSKKRTATLMVLPQTTSIITKSFANLPGVTILTAAELNALVVMNFHHIVFVNPTLVLPVLESKMK